MKYTSDKPMEIVFEFVLICILAFWGLLAMSFCGCSTTQVKQFKSAVVSVGECAMHTSLACASQATAGCELPPAGGDYGEYSQCLVNKSSSCSGRGIGLCLLKGVAQVAGTTLVAAGGVGCTGEESMIEVRSCVADVTLETESEAVSAVAACYRRVCMEE